MAFAFFALVTIAWFGPILFTGRIFISDNYMGGFFSPARLWSDLLYSGFPLYADLSLANPYPVRVLFSALQGLTGRAAAYNLFVCSASFIAATGTYLYVYELALDRLAAAIAGVAFAFCGFMQAQLGHETMTHTAAWLPWIVWSTHRVVRSASWSGVAVLALFAALMYLANHPEIYLQVALVSSLYLVWGAWNTGRAWRTVGLAACGWILSIALVAWQLAGSAEYASFSERVAAARTLTLFGSIPVDRLAQFALPWVFGAPFRSIVAPLVDPDKMAMELASYVAAPVFMLATIALIVRGRERATRFWTFAAVLFFALALGPQTLLGEALFFVPGFSLFRIPARNILSAHFALSVLSGLGAAVLLEGGARVLRRPLFWASAFLPLLLCAALYPLIVQKAAASGLKVAAWRNVAIVLPACIAAASAIAVFLAARPLPRLARAAPLIAVVLVACLYFGWFAPWRVVSGPASAMLNEPRLVNQLRRLADSAPPGRVLVADGWLGPFGPSPNQSMLFGLQVPGGYGPLIAGDYASMSGLTSSGWIRPQTFDEANRALDVLATRWVFPYGGPAARPEEKMGIPWNPMPLGMAIGGECGQGAPRDSATFRLPTLARVSRVALVTTMVCSLEVPKGDAVATMVLERGGKDVARIPLRAGIETAEWSVQCPSAAGALHGAAPIFSSSPSSPGCNANAYLAQLRADNVEAESVRIEWNAGQRFPKAGLHLERITVMGDRPIPLGIADAMFADSQRWLPHKLENGVTVFENRRARPMVWLVSTTRRASSQDQAIRVVTKGRFNDGSVFDPALEAVSEDARLWAIASAALPAAGSVQVREWGSGRIRIDAETAQPAVLVVSQRFYPGWVAVVDGREVPVVRVDGIVQGVALPSGRHSVTLTFAPWWLPWLFLLAGGALFLVIVLLIAGCMRKGVVANDAS